MSFAVDTFLSHLNHLHWGMFAVSLVILELVAPLFFFVWLGLAAGLVGGLVFFFPGLGWKTELLWFGSLSVIMVTLSRVRLRRKPKRTARLTARFAARPIPNRSASLYVGRIFTLTDPILDGEGHLRIDNTTWKIVGQDAVAGENVKVIGFESDVLSVELIDLQII